MDRVKNEEVRIRAGIEMQLESGVDQRVVRWFEHVERMDEYRMARRGLMEEVSVVRMRGKPILGWIDVVQVTLGSRGMTVKAVQQCAEDRKGSALVHTLLTKFYMANFAQQFLCSFGPPSCALVAHHLQRGGMSLQDVVVISCKRARLLISRHRYLAYGLRCVRWIIMRWLFDLT